METNLRASKTQPFIVKHELIEERTRTNDYKPAGDYSLGAKLFMNMTEFESLDAIVIEYVQPLARLIMPVQKHKNYRGDVSLQEIAGLLRDLVTRAPRLHYLIVHNPDWVSKPELAGSFQIYFQFSLTSSKPLWHSRLIVTKDGYLFCGQKFKSIDAVIDYLKRNLADARKWIFEIPSKKQRGGRWGSVGQQPYAQYAPQPPAGGYRGPPVGRAIANYGDM